MNDNIREKLALKTKNPNISLFWWFLQPPDSFADFGNFLKSEMFGRENHTSVTHRILSNYASALASVVCKQCIQGSDKRIGRSRIYILFEDLDWDLDYSEDREKGSRSFAAKFKLDPDPINCLWYSNRNQECPQKRQLGYKNVWFLKPFLPVCSEM